MTIGTCPLSQSLLGVKRALVGALHMSAFDPKRTLASRTCWRIVTRQLPDGALPPASIGGQCRPFVTPRVPSVNGPQDNGQPQ
jgi:hypothetical protein